MLKRLYSYYYLLYRIRACVTGLFVSVYSISVFAQEEGGGGYFNQAPTWIGRIRQGLGTATDWQDALVNFASSIPDIERLITGVAYVLGIIFAIRAMYYLKVYGELRTMMATQASLKAPLTWLIVASVFLFLPTTFSVFMETIFNQPAPTPLTYAPGTSSASYGLGLLSILAFIQLIGYIAFIRGWLIIASVAREGGARESLGKGITHIVGGVLAINIVQTRDIIWQTFGFNP